MGIHSSTFVRNVPRRKHSFKIQVVELGNYFIEFHSEFDVINDICFCSMLLNAPMFLLIP